MKLAICGPKFSGKSTLGRAIVAHDPEYCVEHFADPLKTLCMQVFGLTEFQVSDPAAKEYALAAPIHIDHCLGMLREATGSRVQPQGIVARTPRQLLQAVGTEYVRAAYPRFWLDALAAKIRHLDKVLVPDTRFLNEAELVREMGGKVVRVVRPDLSSTDTHISEREMASIVHDFEIVNRLDDRLLRQAAHLLEQLGER